MSVSQLKAHLKQKGLPQLLVLEGDEDHLMKEALKEIKSHVSDDIEMFNLYGDQVVSEDFHNDLNTLSFFGAIKFYLVRSSESLPIDSIESILEIFKLNPDGLKLALLFKKIDKRKKIFKELLSISTVFELKPPYENQMNQWVQSLAKDKSLSLKTSHIELIRHLVGDGLTDLSEALDRLNDSYKKEDGALTDEKIQKIVAQKRRSDLFAICDLIGHADFTGASLEMDRALKEGESPVSFIHLLLRHFDILFKIKNESPKASKYDIAKVVGVPAFFVPNYKNQSDTWGREEILSMQSLLEEFDLMSKSAGVKPHALTSALLIKATAIFGKKEKFISL